MPAALALGNGHVVCGQEVVGLGTSPWIADTLYGRTRNYYLAQDQYDFGGAPFLARAPDGGTLLTYHSQRLQAPAFKRLPGAWMFSQIYVQHGGAEADRFGPASCPWPTVTEHGGAFFPSLMVMNNGTLVALASFITVHPDRTISTVVRWIKGRLTTPAARSSSGGTANLARPPFAPPRDAAEYKYGPPPEAESARSDPGN